MFSPVQFLQLHLTNFNLLVQVENLKRELHKASDEVRHQQEGIDKLEQVNQKLSENGPYQIDMARDKLNEMKDVKEKLLQGEKEKIQLLQDLLKQRDEYQYNDYLIRQTVSVRILKRKFCQKLHQFFC